MTEEGFNWCGDALRKPQSAAEIGSRDYGDLAAHLEIEEVVVVRDDEVRLTVNGAFENAVVIRVGGNEIKSGRCDDHLRNLCDQADAPLKVGLRPTKIPPQHFGDLPDYGK